MGRGKFQMAPVQVQKKPLPLEFVTNVNRGIKLAEAGKTEEAEACYEEAARLCPEAWLGIATEELRAGNKQVAMARVKQVIVHATFDKTLAVARNLMGVILNNSGCRSTSEPWFRESFALWKRAETATNIALCCMYAHRLDEAEKWLDRAIRLEPTNNTIWFDHALVKLLQGDYKTGFREYEARWKNENTKLDKLQVFRPEWNGESLAGKTLLVYGEQGAGDTIQMLRYGPELKKRTGTLLLAPQTGLGGLAVRQGCWDAVIMDLPGRISKGNIPAWDYQVPAMSLPRILGTTLDNIPPAPYLTPPYMSSSYNPTAFNVGFCWAGSLDHAHDLWRSTGLDDWTPVFELSGIRWHSLQLGQRTVDLLGSAFPINDLSPELKTYDDTAAAIASMDLIISVDTSIVHLAGALGKSVWMLTPYSPDWRWMLDREDSPWYSSLRLFRQTKEHDWKSVFERIADELKALYEDKTDRRLLQRA